MKDWAWEYAKAMTARLNAMEDKLALERYGVKFNDLGEDERGEIAMDVADMMDEE